MFGNPVPGVIRPPGSALQVGRFRVTQTFQQHLANGLAPGVDISNGREGDPVLAMEAGNVSAVFIDPGNQALIVRIRHTGALSAFETGYAHLASASVTVGQPVVRGQQIGLVGHSGAEFAHLHGGCKRNGVEIDWWPLLDQNQAEDAVITITTYPALRTWKARGGSLTGRRLSPAPLSMTGTFDAGSPAHADAEVQITPKPAGWPAGPYLRVTDGGLAGFLVAIGQVDPEPIPPPDCTAAVEAAVAPLREEIARLEAEVAALRQPPP